MAQKKHTPIYLLVLFLLLFGVFIYFITRPSNSNIAINEIELCTNEKEVDTVWEKHKHKLLSNESFLYSVRKKLTNLNLSNSKIKEWTNKLPPAPTSLNMIVIPDLSRRIIYIPGQIENDNMVLKEIWEIFKDYTSKKKNTKDRLIIDVTDKDQASGSFNLVADSLQFDLSKHKDKINKLYYTKDNDNKFYNNIDKLYKLAKNRPLGADYVFYLRRYLGNHLKESTLFDNYINKVIIITDGYLEAEGNPVIVYTKFLGYQSELYSAVKNDNILEVINQYRLNIPKVNIDLSNTEFLICEIDERESGTSYDFDILKVYWEDWLNRMNTKKVTFIQKEESSNLTKERIRKFIEN